MNAIRTRYPQTYSLLMPLEITGNLIWLYEAQMYTRPLQFSALRYLESHWTEIYQRTITNADVNAEFRAEYPNICRCFTITTHKSWCYIFVSALNLLKIKIYDGFLNRLENLLAASMLAARQAAVNAILPQPIAEAVNEYL